MSTLALTNAPKPNDLRRQDGINAYEWMSFHPERRADQDAAGAAAWAVARAAAGAVARDAAGAAAWDAARAAAGAVARDAAGDADLKEAARKTEVKYIDGEPSPSNSGDTP